MSYYILDVLCYFKVRTAQDSSGSKIMMDGLFIYHLLQFLCVTVISVNSDVTKIKIIRQQ